MSEFLVGSALAQESRSDEMTVTLQPGEGAEVKLVMAAGAKANFSWDAGGAKVNYDLHGDGADRTSPTGRVAVSRARAVLEAAFPGNHGWFWRNRTDAPVSVTLKTNGAYGDIKRM